jgi:metallophosphoesterase (TIGR00282 family)
VGYCVYDLGKQKAVVLNVMGNLYLDSLESPFTTVERILKKVGNAITIIDFHAEATSEKKALGLYFDGKVSAVFGTHTHVQTADEQILPKGTAFITDLGMTGPKDSVLGADPKPAVERFITKMPARFRPAKGKCSLNGIILCIDDKNCLANSITRIQIE